MVSTRTVLGRHPRRCSRPGHLATGKPCDKLAALTIPSRSSPPPRTFPPVPSRFAGTVPAVAARRATFQRFAGNCSGHSGSRL